MKRLPKPHTPKFIGGVVALLRRIPHPPLRSKRGMFVFFLLVAGFGSLATIGGVMAVSYSETPSFCGRCHTMAPELKAYAMSPHKELPCAECHVEPSAAGWIKAKIKGTKQLFEVVSGQFPTPIPPPDHADLPPVAHTCMKCHSLDRINANGGPIKLILRPQYKSDESNTKELIALVLRPGDQGEGGVGEGVHWHVEQNVTYTTSDIRSRKIDFIEIKYKDGTQAQYIASAQIGAPSNVNPDIERLLKTERTRVMDCIDCHNRIGHGVPSTTKAVDEALSTGKINSGLPYIKRDSVNLLNATYPSLSSADKAIDGLRDTYSAKYPLLLNTHGEEVTQAITELKTIYRLIATPRMKVQASTYPDNLGHKNSPGCFRCHDGAHFKVVKGQITTQTIPSACATCHTFPQVGTKVSDLLLGSKPTTHKDKLYVFNHKSTVSSIEPAGTSCGACHGRTYCENCHNSGAIKVTHTEMLYNHAAVIDRAGSTRACAFCHQPVYCARCHEKQVLKVSKTQVAKLGP